MSLVSLFSSFFGWIYDENGETSDINSAPMQERAAVFTTAARPYYARISS